MTPEELAHEMALKYGRNGLGDWLGYGEWLWDHGLPCEDDDIARFEELHRDALDNL